MFLSVCLNVCIYKIGKDERCADGLCVFLECTSRGWNRGS